MNFSIRKSQERGLHHLGWEDSSANAFSSEIDVNGITWETFNEEEQVKEIVSAWPDYQQKP